MWDFCTTDTSIPCNIPLRVLYFLFMLINSYFTVYFHCACYTKYFYSNCRLFYMVHQHTGVYTPLLGRGWVTSECGSGGTCTTGVMSRPSSVGIGPRTEDPRDLCLRIPRSRNLTGIIGSPRCGSEGRRGARRTTVALRQSRSGVRQEPEGVLSLRQSNYCSYRILSFLS